MQTQTLGSEACNDEFTQQRLAALATVDGWPVNISDIGMACVEITRAASLGKSFAAVTMNMDHLTKLRADDNFRRAYRAAEFVTADGAPISLFSRLQGADVHRASGSDLVIPLCEQASKEGLKVFLFGTHARILEKASLAINAATRDPALIVGHDSPKYDFVPNSKEADEAIERIADSGANICFVALGAPKQEIFAARAVSKGIPVGFVGIGAALDFLAGEEIRAPKIIRKIGFEWTWRLIMRPRQLSKRYAMCLLLFTRLVIQHIKKEMQK